TTQLYTLSLHDALPIWRNRKVNANAPPFWRGLEEAGKSRAYSDFRGVGKENDKRRKTGRPGLRLGTAQALRGKGNRMKRGRGERSEEHTSELQSRENLV